MLLDRRVVQCLFIGLFSLILVANVHAAGESEPQPDNPVQIDLATLAPGDKAEVYEAAQVLGEIWSELGFDVEVSPRPFHTHNPVTREEPWPFNVVFFGWGGRPERLDPNTFLFMPFHSSQAVSGGENRIGFENLEYDRLVDQQAQAMELDERRPLVFAAQELLAEEAVMTVMWFPDRINFYNTERFDGFVAMPGEGIDSEWTPMFVEPLTDDTILRVGMVEEPDMLNPMAMTSTQAVGLARNIFDRLVRIGTDGEPQPHMAESWEMISDTVIEFQLREGMEWHDGEPVTAEDVAFTFGYHKEYPVAFLQPWVEPIQDVTATGPLSVRFELNEPFAPFIPATLGQLFIIPQHIWADVVDEQGIDHPDEWTDHSRAMIGSGPFKLEHWREGEEIVVSTHEGYFMEPNIDGMIFVMHGSTDGVAGSLETGLVDFNQPVLLPPQIARLQQEPHLEEVVTAGIGFDYFAFNIRKPPFDDKIVRQALMHAVDYDLLLNGILEGRGTVGGPGRLITPENEPYYNPALDDLPEFDLDRARTMLEDAGYRWDNRGQIHYPED